MSLIPLSYLLNKEKRGYNIHDIYGKDQYISHLMFVDDIKIYAPSEKKLKNLLHTTEKFNNDVGLKFGLSKCSVAATKKGEVHATNPIAMSEGSIEPLQDAYTYLGVKQTTTTKILQIPILPD